MNCHHGEPADPKWTVKMLLKDLNFAQSLLQSVDPSSNPPLLSLTRVTYTTVIQRFNDTSPGSA
ncbi:hypothetical protein DIPPA_02322 [Diplonema papillatum]|nr:hypothetical protein DIPPA_02322 [Diplonema papillatum]